MSVLLQTHGWAVINARDCDDIKAEVESPGVIALISESSLPDCSPDDILQYCSKLGRPVIFTGHDLPLQGAVDLIRKGATDFLDKPFPQSRLLDLLDRLVNRQNR